MQTLFTVIGLALLAIIAYFLNAIRELHRAQMLLDDSVRQQQELDQTVEHFCPNLFFEYRSELRNWFEIIERKQIIIRHFEVFDTDSNDEVESDWQSICYRLVKESSSESPRWKEHLKELNDVTDEFIKSAPRDTRPTQTEVNFLLFRYWKDRINKPYPDPIHSMVLEYLTEELGRYREIIPSCKVPWELQPSNFALRKESPTGRCLGCGDTINHEYRKKITLTTHSFDNLYSEFARDVLEGRNDDLFVEVINKFTSERLKSYYLDNPRVAERPLWALDEARALLRSHSEAALVFAFYSKRGWPEILSSEANSSWTGSCGLCGCSNRRTRAGAKKQQVSGSLVLNSSRSTAESTSKVSNARAQARHCGMR